MLFYLLFFDPVFNCTFDLQHQYLLVCMTSLFSGHIVLLQCYNIQIRFSAELVYEYGCDYIQIVQ